LHDSNENNIFPSKACARLESATAHFLGLSGLAWFGDP
jgi:hypothetical protein